MRSGFKLGDKFIMHTRSGESGSDEVIVLTLDDRGVEVT